MVAQNPPPAESKNGATESPEATIQDIANKLRQMPRNKPLDPDSLGKDLARLSQYKEIPTPKLANDLAVAFRNSSDQKSLIERVTSNLLLTVIVSALGVALVIAMIAVIVMTLPPPIPPPVPPPTEISIKPSEIIFETKPTDLVADGISKADIRVFVLDQNKKPVSDGVPVQFRVDHTDLGSVEPSDAKTQDGRGRAQTTFTAKQMEGDVQVIATIGDNIRNSITIHLTKPQQEQPVLTIALSADPNHAVPAGNNVTLIFSVKNNATVPAANVSLATEIPAGTTFVGAQDGVTPNPQNQIVWQLGRIRQGEERKRTLTVNIPQNPDTAPIKLSDYMLYDGNGVAIKTEGKIQLSIPVQQAEVSSAPASIEISSLNPNTLPADEKSTATIIVTVRDSKGNPVKDPATVQFTLQPKDVGRIEPNPALTLDGQATVTFTSGNNPVPVKIVASVGSITKDVSITLTAPSRTANLKQVYHLITEPSYADNKLVIFQMPVGTPLELLGEPSDDWQKVAVRVWVERNMVIQNAQGQTVFAGDVKFKTVLLGNNPEDTSDLLNRNGTRQLYSAAPNYPVQIIDESNSTYFRIRIEGWTQANKF